MTFQMTGTNSEPLASVESLGEPVVSPDNFETFEREDTVIEGLLSRLYKVQECTHPLIFMSLFKNGYF